MSLSPRAIAVQGLGFSPRLVAMQGLWPHATSFPNMAARRIREQTQFNDDDEVLLLFAAAVAIIEGNL
jgi:hypothetical protein